MTSSNLTEQVKMSERVIEQEVSKIIQALFIKNPQLKSMCFIPYEHGGLWIEINGERLQRIYDLGQVVNFDPENPPVLNEEGNAALVAMNLKNKELAHISKDIRELPIFLKTFLYPGV